MTAGTKTESLAYPTVTKSHDPTIFSFESIKVFIRRTDRQMDTPPIWWAKQEAQLSQRDRVTLHVTEYFA